MFMKSLILSGLLASTASATAIKRDDPIPPDTIKSCTFYYQAEDKNYKCDNFAKDFAISVDDFKFWNPSVKSDCSGLKVGVGYCVEAPEHAPVTKITTTTTTTSTTTTTTPGNSAPSPTQDGLTKDCKQYYKAVAGDNCDKISKKYGTFSISDFISWNPAVGGDCTGLWASYYYCVGVANTPDKPTTTSQGPTGPTPTQDGITKDCKTYYKAQSGDTCDVISKRYGTFSSSDFIKWNPAVGGDCSGLWASYYYCVGVSGTPDKPTTTSQNPTGPSPTQDGIPKDCNKFYKVQSGDGCQAIVDRYPGLKLSDFYSWNPALQNDCSRLLRDYYYCIGVPYGFGIRTKYHTDCTGDSLDNFLINTNDDGRCINTNCAVGSLDISPEGLCPGGQVQISYWQNADCQGDWYGYGYASRGQCRRLWSDGWKFRSLHFRCTNPNDDCVNKKQCDYAPEPDRGSCQ